MENNVKCAKCGNAEDFIYVTEKVNIPKKHINIIRLLGVISLIIAVIFVILYINTPLEDQIKEQINYNSINVFNADVSGGITGPPKEYTDMNLLANVIYTFLGIGVGLFILEEVIYLIRPVKCQTKTKIICPKCQNYWYLEDMINNIA